MKTEHVPPDFARMHGWDAQYEPFLPPEIPTYTGALVSFGRRDLVEAAAELARRAPDVAIIGAPVDEAVSYRPGARFGPRAIRQAAYNHGGYSLALGIEPFEFLDVVDAGDADVAPAALERNHAMVYRKVLEVASCGALPIILGGDHSITWPAASAIATARAPHTIGIVHFDAHADTASQDWGVLAGHGTPMRRLVESGAVKGANFVQVGLRGYWPPPDVFAWMQAQGLRWHLMSEIEERGADAVVDQAIAEALDGPDLIYLSIDIDVLDPGLAPGTGTPEPGGLMTRELLRAVRRIVGQVRLAAMDVVEVAPAYDTSEVTAAAAHRCVLEAISALAVKRRAGESVRFAPAAMAAAGTGMAAAGTGG
jgi:formimidoylglutamase